MADEPNLPKPKVAGGAALNAPAPGTMGDGVPVPKVVSKPEPEVYRDNSSRAQRAMFGIGANLLLAAVNMVIGGFTLAYLGGPDSYGALQTIEVVEIIVALLYFIAIIVAAVFFLMWLNRAVKNLEPLGVREYKYTSGWAVGWWFIPFANLVMPFMVVRDLWKASVPGLTGTDWKDLSAGPLMGFWWATWIISNVAANVGIRGALMDDPSIDELQVSYWTGVISDGFTLVAGMLCILIVLQIDENQSEKAVQLGVASA